MKIVNIKAVGQKNVYDLSVQDQEHYILENGVITHNTGSYYAADNIWIVGRQQDKDTEGLNGYHFVINIEKSRYVREKSKIPITVSFDEGIMQWSGLADLAIEAGIITNPSKGWYAFGDEKMRWNDFVNDGAFWQGVLRTTELKAFIKKKYQLSPAEISLDDDAEGND